jgi:hypothetical protein
LGNKEVYWSLYQLICYLMEIYPSADLHSVLILIIRSKFKPSVFQICHFIYKLHSIQHW